jgi:myo-inositol-1(or 4)-monophosphatase
LNLQATREITIDIALQAGAELRRFFDQPHEEATKQNIFDIVTEGDKASEAIIVPALQAAFPDHHFVAEEGGGSGVPAEEAEYFWYIDPVDGTSNFANNIPYFAASIALADRHMNPLVGVVLNPVYNELFSAARGHGATTNPFCVRVSLTAAPPTPTITSIAGATSCLVCAICAALGRRRSIYVSWPLAASMATGKAGSTPGTAWRG